MWCSEVRAIKWLWHHHPFCDGLIVAHTSDSFLIGQRWAFRLLTVSLYWSEFTVVSVDKNFGRIIPCLTQKTVAMIVPADDTLLNFFFLCYVMWHTIPSTAAWIRVQNGRSRSRTPWQLGTGSHHLLYHVSAKEQWWLLSLPLCVHLSVCVITHN